MFGRGNKKVEPRKTNARVPTPEDVEARVRDRRVSTRRFLRLVLAVALPTVFGIAALGGRLRGRARRAGAREVATPAVWSKCDSVV